MPQSKARQEQLYPFTKRCKDADIARPEPADTWFQDRGVAIPTSKPQKIEVFAAHAWAHGCCNFADEPATVRGWNTTLSDQERVFLFAVCQHGTVTAAPHGRREAGIQAGAGDPAAQGVSPAAADAPASRPRRRLGAPFAPSRRCLRRAHPRPLAQVKEAGQGAEAGRRTLARVRR